MTDVTDDEFPTDNYELLGLAGGGVLRTHGRAGCFCGPCVIHNPSSHHMITWRLLFRSDRHWLAERLCPHGIGHPDPDSVAYFEATGVQDMGVHGCDGCCTPPQEARP